MSDATGDNKETKTGEAEKEFLTRPAGRRRCSVLPVATLKTTGVTLTQLKANETPQKACISKSGLNMHLEPMVG